MAAINQSELRKPTRLDAYLLEKHTNVSRAQLQRIIKEGKVTVNNEVQTKSGFIVKEPARVEIDFNFEQTAVVPDIKIQVLYEDETCVVIDKPLGVLTHSKGAFNPEGTVASWLSQRLHFNFPTEDGSQRSGIVHRLDRATSGVMICAKEPTALRHLQKQFQDRKAKKIYIARVAGNLQPPQALIDLPVERNPKQPQRFRVGQNGKSAQTSYAVTSTIEQAGGTDSLVELKPLTGRTHQLRVHLAYVKHPIIGDTFYSGRSADRLYLHAYQLEITLPNRQRTTFTSDVPKEFYRTNL